MKIVTKLTESDVIRFGFYVFFRRRIIRIATGLMICAIFFSFLFPEAAKPGKPNVLFSLIIFLVVFPMIVYVTTKRNFKNHRRLHEQIEYVFDEQNLIINGESFNTTMTWNKIFRVTKTKRWILVWQAQNLANLIPLKDVSGSDILHLKKILRRHGVKNNL